MWKFTSENHRFIHLQKFYFWERIQISIFTELSRLDKLQILQRLWLPLLKYSTGWTFILMFHNLFACTITMPICATCIEMLTFATFLHVLSSFHALQNHLMTQWPIELWIDDYILFCRKLFPPLLSSIHKSKEDKM